MRMYFSNLQKQSIHSTKSTVSSDDHPQ